MRAIVVIVAKQPVPACVKTRLCPPLSPGDAAALYTLFIQDMIEEMCRLPHGPQAVHCAITVALAYAPEGAEAAFKALLPEGIMLFPQQGRDLGERLAGIFRRLCGNGYEQVHIINSDSPDLPCSLIIDSVRCLGNPRTDLVLGPSRDGGYYLIGLKRHKPELFGHIPWSTDRVLAATLQRARQVGLSCALLDSWYDVDTYEDILWFIDRNRQRPDSGYAPGWRTLRYLRHRIGNPAGKDGHLCTNAFNG